MRKKDPSNDLSHTPYFHDKSLVLAGITTCILIRMATANCNLSHFDNIRCQNSLWYSSRVFGHSVAPKTLVIWWYTVAFFFSVGSEFFMVPLLCMVLYGSVFSAKQRDMGFFVSIFSSCCQHNSQRHAQRWRHNSVSLWAAMWSKMRAVSTHIPCTWTCVAQVVEDYKGILLAKSVTTKTLLKKTTHVNIRAWAVHVCPDIWHTSTADAMSKPCGCVHAILLWFKADSIRGRVWHSFTPWCSACSEFVYKHFLRLTFLSPQYVGLCRPKTVGSTDTQKTHRKITFCIPC